MSAGFERREVEHSSFGVRLANGESCFSYRGLLRVTRRPADAHRPERSGTPFRPGPFGTFRGNGKLSIQHPSALLGQFLSRFIVITLCMFSSRDRRRGHAMNVVVIVNLCDSATSFGMMTIMSAQDHESHGSRSRTRSDFSSPTSSRSPPGFPVGIRFLTGIT